MNVATDEGTVHDVLFAESDAELVSVAGARLAGSLEAGATVIVIASREHRDRFVEVVREAGIDPAAAVADDRLVLLDAAETLAALTPGGSFDPTAFDRVLGARVRAASVDRPVQVFGEVLALLWEAGRIEEAIGLERAWEVVLRETSSSLLCAYPIRVADDAGTASEVREVCGLHERILSEEAFERSWRFAHDDAAASHARRAVAAALRVRGVEESTFYDVQSVLTELVGSALRSSRSAIRVGLEVTTDRVVLRVVGGHPGADAGPRGVSLRIVDELADRWGIEPAAAGTAVWAELDR